ncbi:sarcosine oxidase subunit gamma [Marinomonas balearica]|uniref:N-methylglutamate dehydrogenase subunit D n=1 Tax=Marinomonas balearica TaxID=491947 RepID=A0A4R6M268_9GAMM|nr:sarcosine oxidase subunit gamma [Marinomonas balearica]TDO95341.1 N-methylglutamate dehydrogenase subunit D [Marinomonas balearica]
MTALNNDFNLSAASHLRRSVVEVEQQVSPNAGVTISNHTVKARIGFRGKGAIAFLREQGVTIPEKPNQATFSGGFAVLRLSFTEIWLLDIESDSNETFEPKQKSKSEYIAALESAAKNSPDVYRLFCQHSHALFSFNERDKGTLANLFAKICGVDLRESVFPSGSIAQTSVARVNAVVFKQVISEKTERYYLLSDISSSEYLWDALVDAAGEF